MASVSPGVVGMAEVVVPNSSITGNFAGTNVMWSFVWAGLAALFLLFVHAAMLGRGR